ncbi:MAG: YceI family protein [Cytophagales bacterium]|nr:YceI family protein [Cytophagales bacterium]
MKNLSSFLKALSFLSLALMFTACNTGTKSDTATTEAAEEAAAPAEEKINIANAPIDLAQSLVAWKGEMLGVYAHEGTLKFSEGTVTVSDGEITGGNFVVDMTSMVPTDENFNPEEGKTKEKLVGHLSSDDFFAVTDNPTASFTINEISGNTAKGTLTVRGKTGEETVENLSVTREGDKVKLTGTLKFNRKNYDVAFDHPVQEMVISDEVQLNIELLASSSSS